MILFFLVSKQQEMKDSVCGNYVSEYGEYIIVQPDVFIENKTSLGEEYLIVSQIIKKKRGKWYVLFLKSDTHVGTFGQLDFIHGEVSLHHHHYTYFAYYFSAYGANNLSEVCVPTEKDLRKYTFCIETPICSRSPLTLPDSTLLQELKHLVMSNKTKTI